jgi:nucleotide-binding universal stress UspA family protein
MYSIKRIVAATDMSPFAARAEERAARLVHELESESLHLLHVVDNLPLEALRHLDQPPLDTEYHLIESSRKQLAEIEHKLSAKYQAKVITTTLNVGRPHNDIVRYAKLLNAELIVMGVHGGFARKLVGSTVDKVLRQSVTPLLLVKEVPRGPYQRILVPVDFSDSSKRAIEMAMSISPHATVTVLHAFEAPLIGKMRLYGVSHERIEAYRAQVRAERISKMQQLTAEAHLEGSSGSQLVELGEASDVILKQAKVLESDLIIVGKHGQSPWEDMLLGSVAQQVIEESTCDVLIIEQEHSKSG